MAQSFRRSAAALSDADLAMFESRHDVSLPADYRAFLLETNGGVPRNPRFSHVSGKGKKRKTWVRCVLPLGRGGLAEPEWPDLEQAWNDRPAGLPAGVLPVGEAWYEGNDGFVCLACDGPDAGKVYFRPEVEPEKTTLYEVADSWTEFVNGLEPDGKPKEWREAIIEHDLPRLRKWLETNQERLEDGILRGEVGEAIVEEDFREAIAPFFELGGDPPWVYTDALRRNRFDIVRLLIAGDFVSSEMARNSFHEATPFLWHLPEEFWGELVAAGADIDQESDSGETPLHKAVEARSPAGVRWLLDRGADPTAKDDDGRTPLGLARRLEELELVRILQVGEAAWAARPAPVETVGTFDFRGVAMAEPGIAITPEEIAAFEGTVGFTLPAEYKAFLLASNGGTPRPNTLPAGTIPDDDADEDDEEYEEDEDDEDGDEQSWEDSEPRVIFYPLTNASAGAKEEEVDPEKDDEAWYGNNTVEEARGWYHDGSEIPRGKLPIAVLIDYGCEGSGFLLIGCKGKDRGKLFAFDHGSTPLGLTLPELFEKLAESKSRPRSAGEFLADAVEARDIDGVRAVLAGGEPVPWSTRDGRLPIRTACKTGFDEAILAFAGTKIDMEQLLTEAAQEGRTEVVRTILERGDVPKRAVATLLDVRETYHDLELLKLIEANGINLKKRLDKRPEILVAAASSGSVAGLGYLFERGGDVQYRSREDGETLLHAAAWSEDERAADVVRMLLERGVPVNETSSQGQTALHRAVQVGNLAVSKLLIDAGADLHATYEVFPYGMSRKKAAAQAQKIAKMSDKLMADMTKMFGDDEDGPPPPDTSEPAGEKAAAILESLEHLPAAMAARMAEMNEKMSSMAAGSWGNGPSAADWARRYGPAQKILDELEAYAAGKK